jgi:glycosyltransferase involved in cell wall biosynthesis
MTPVRVLHLITGLGLGGAETWLARLLPGLAARGFSCQVASLLDLSGPGGALAQGIRAEGVPVHSLGLARGLPLASGGAALLRLAGLLRRTRPAVVQTWLYHADLLGLLAARLSGTGAAVSWGLRCGHMDFSRSGVGTRLAVRACSALSAWPEAVTANSEAGARWHVERLGYRPRRLVLLENGVDTALFRPNAQAREELRSMWGVGPDELLVGLAARLDPMKGHDVFCAALARLRARFPNVRPLFCGPGTEPGGGLDALLARHGLAERALRLGPRQDMPRVLAALDALALPSLGEGFPNALAEGLACGVPAACLDVGAARELAGPGGVVASVEVADAGARAEALVGALGRVLELGPEGRAAMGLAGRRHVAERYGLGAAADRWAAHLRGLAEGA